MFEIFFYFPRLSVRFNASIIKTNSVTSLFPVNLPFKYIGICKQNRWYNYLMGLLFISFILISYLFRKQNLYLLQIQGKVWGIKTVRWWREQPGFQLGSDSHLTDDAPVSEE